MKVLTIREMKDLEAQADLSGVSYDTMMQNAGQNLANWIENKFQEQNKRIVLGLIGSGKNGSDTLIALTQLVSHGWFCLAFCVKSRGQEDHFLEAFDKSGGLVVREIDRIQGIIVHRCEATLSFELTW